MGQARVLVDDLLGAVAVDPDRAAVDDALDACVPRSLEHGRGRARVAALGADRIGLDVADVGHCREVDHRNGALHRALDLGSEEIVREVEHGEIGLVAARGVVGAADTVHVREAHHREPEPAAL